MEDGMAKFRVRLMQTVVEEAFVEVEADNATAAKAAAKGLAMEGNVEWNLFEALAALDEPGDIDVAECEAI